MDGIENLYARQVLEQAADTVRQGASLYNALAGETLSADHAVYDCLRRRERELGSLMDRAAENRESALQHRITLTLSVFEPALVVTMATVVYLSCCQYYNRFFSSIIWWVKYVFKTK